MRPPVTIPNVDLVAAGTWELSSGRQTFTRQDLQHALQAARCPAVGPPVIKIGHTDTRFTPGDGEPALGKVTNMRLTANGSKLVGDLTSMPARLADIAASAYPNRSIEGAYNHRCQNGHVHEFVITGLALLGVTPPGVGVLNRLDDITALYDVAASTGDPVPFHVRCPAPIPDDWDEDSDEYVDVTDLLTIDPAEAGLDAAPPATQASAGGAMSNDKAARILAAHKSIMGAAYRGCFSPQGAIQWAVRAARGDDVSYHLDSLGAGLREFSAAAAADPALSSEVMDVLSGAYVERPVVAHSNQQAANQAHQAVDQASLPRQYADMAHQAVDQTFGQLDEPDDPFSGLFAPTSPLGPPIDDSGNPVGLGHYTPPRTSQVIQRASAGAGELSDDEVFYRMYGFWPKGF